jgi:hypothetical protein
MGYHSLLAFLLVLQSKLLKSNEIMQILREKMEDKKNKVRRPVLHNQAYVDLIYAEIDTLQSVVSEIYDTERRKESAREN